MKTILAIIIAAHTCCLAAPITLTDIQGRTITVEVLSLADGSLTVRKADGSEASIPLDNLSPESRAAATKTVKPKPSRRVPYNPGAPAQAARTAPAPPPAPTPPVVSASGLKLTSVSNAVGKVTDKSWETSWGSYDKDVFRSRAVVITAVADTSGKAILEMHWIGSVAGSPSDRGVVMFAKKEITLVAREPQTHEFAALFVESDANYKALGVRDREGLKYAGWVARVISPDGRTLTAIAARPPLITMIDPPDPARKPSH